jgi:hypothetical protein
MWLMEAKMTSGCTPAASALLSAARFVEVEMALGSLATIVVVVEVEMAPGCASADSPPSPLLRSVGVGMASGCMPTPAPAVYCRLCTYTGYLGGTWLMPDALMDPLNLY